MKFSIEHPQFVTMTIFQWRYLLKPVKYKRIIVDSLSFLVQNKRVVIYGFVIMDNHLHLIWQISSEHKQENVRRDFLKFTAQKIKFDLQENHPNVLKQFKVDLKDREYQFWKRSSLSIDLFSKRVFEQKLDYIHNNPVKAGLCNLPEQYFYSSAAYYLLNKESFDFITHCDMYLVTTPTTAKLRDQFVRSS